MLSNPVDVADSIAASLVVYGTSGVRPRHPIVWYITRPGPVLLHILQVHFFATFQQSCRKFQNLQILCKFLFSNKFAWKKLQIHAKLREKLQVSDRSCNFCRIIASLHQTSKLRKNDIDKSQILYMYVLQWIHYHYIRIPGTLQTIQTI
jgi:hypothetical protein